MKKIISLFQRNYETDRLVRNEVVPGAEWVLKGEGIPTVMYDGMACMVNGGKLYKRSNRKVTKKARRRGPPFSEGDCRPAPKRWEAAEPKLDENTGHWPGWIEVSQFDPQDRWHLEAWNISTMKPPDGTYELVGPKVRRNPYGISDHHLIWHGCACIDDLDMTKGASPFDSIRAYLESHSMMEGIIWHHPDGRMVKIKRRDFGLPWPARKENQ